MKKGEVIGLERRFLCVSWFARYDKSFALDPFWPKEEREKNGWWCWPASFFPIKIQVDDRRTGHTGNYGIHWILFFYDLFVNHRRQRRAGLQESMNMGIPKMMVMRVWQVLCLLNLSFPNLSYQNLKSFWVWIYFFKVLLWTGKGFITWLIYLCNLRGSS